MSGEYILAIDQGTSSSRCILYNHTGHKECSKAREVPSIHLHPGWTEQDPKILIKSIEECVKAVLEEKKIGPKHIRAIGITNQRETTIAWDKYTGEPLSNAIVWLDARNSALVERILAKKCRGNRDYLRKKCGLPLSTYFSATKMAWLMEENEAVAKAVKEQRCAFGTVDSWIIFNLTGKQAHATDVSNASRTMLMNMYTCKWDPYLCKFFNIPMETLPLIRSSAEIYGVVAPGHILEGVRIAGVLGDQQAALVGQGCLTPGDAKNTYGTGCFMLFNTGNTAVQSTKGLLTTVAYQFGPNQRPVYALEGSVAVAGVGLRWLRDRLGLLKTFEAIDIEASKVPTTGDVYFVPAFSGLFAPYWREDARGTIVGMTQYTEATHIIRALLESICFQTKVIAEAMQKDAKRVLRRLRVDGGLSRSEVLLQIQSDLLGIPVERPDDVEATAFGSAFAAGYATGMYSLDQFSSDVTSVDARFENKITQQEREARTRKWDMAVERSLNWAPITHDVSDYHGPFIVPLVYNYLKEHAAPILVTAAATAGLFYFISNRQKS